jgi:hypothetical protein
MSAIIKAMPMELEESLMHQTGGVKGSKLAAAQLMMRGALQLLIELLKELIAEFRLIGFHTRC